MPNICDEPDISGQERCYDEPVISAGDLWTWFLLFFID